MTDVGTRLRKKDIGNGSKTKVLMDSGEVMVGN